MRRLWLVAFIGLSLLAGGCTPLANTARTILIEPLAYFDSLDCLIELNRNHKLAKAAFAEYQARQGTTHSKDFAAGFTEGYCQFLFAGGTGEPPPLPPRCYWRSCYQTPEGQAAIRDWFAGFRQGATIARDSGLRELMVVPSSLMALKPGPVHQLAPAAPAPELLPPPRVLPSEAPLLKPVLERIHGPAATQRLTVMPPLTVPPEVVMPPLRLMSAAPPPVSLRPPTALVILPVEHRSDNQGERSASSPR